ncbi:MAG: hypothetical protein QOK19_583 [Solirubrobacteraceae bacterium]|nr:hypothetical protein [Solirubrobacteraceae bacterium]
MKRYHRLTLLSIVVCLATAFAAPAARGLSVKEGSWEAGTCIVKSCTYGGPTGNFFTQAAGHPPWGITTFEVNAPGGKPDGVVKRIRVDVPEGLAANPQALPSCTRAEFNSSPALCEAKGAKVGEAEAVSALEDPVLHTTQEASNTGNVYNLTPEAGLPLLFGIAIEPTGGVLLSPIHLMLEGHVSWGFEPALAARGIPSGDFHEWFQIDNVPQTVEANILGIPVANAKLSTIKSKLYFEGQKGGHFLTLPSACSASTTSYLELESYEGAHTSAVTHTPVGVSNCGAVPFKPTAVVKPETSQHDTPDGAETIVTVPQSDEINTADIKDAHVVLPEGLTLNPSAANGLQACTQAQLGKGGTAPVACPAASKIGTVLIETALPKGSLAGNVYLGKANGTGAITAPPYLIFIDAETELGVSVRLEGAAVPNPTTGRLDISFLKNPQLPFSELRLKVNGGPRSPLANSVTCGTTSTDSGFTPWTGLAPFGSSSPFATTGCPNPVPFAIAQTTPESTNKAGAFTSWNFNLHRPDGNQNLGRVQTTLPAGLVGLIPSVKLCNEPQAASGSCAPTSQIGTATASAGVGSEPFTFSGPVYLTGPTEGQPYGLSIPIEAAAGPFDLGRVTTRVAIGVDPHTARVIATSNLPRIVGGVPLHLQGLNVAVNKPNFLFNPTNCGPLSTNSLLGAIQGATAAPATPFAVTACTSLPFNPVFAASSPTAPSRANGASLTVSYTQPDHQANIKSVVASLPKELPSRLTTLHQACPENIFAGGTNYKACPPGSNVGTASVTTPVLPEKLTGPAYLVSHGGAAFPDLDLILEGNHGVKVILEGNTNIKNGITTSTFAMVPDVPVSSFELKLPTGPHSALGSFGSLCAKPLYMPTTITAQSGTVSKQNLHLSVGSCKIKILSHKVKKHKLVLRVKVFTAGRLSVKSPGLHTTFRKAGGPGVVTIKVPLSKKGKRTLAAGRALKVKVRVGFSPKHKDEFHSAAFAKATFKH